MEPKIHYHIHKSLPAAHILTIPSAHITPDFNPFCESFFWTLIYNEEVPKNISAHVQCACVNMCLCEQARVCMCT